MECKQNFYLGTHSHYKNIISGGKSQGVEVQKKEIFLKIFENFAFYRPFPANYQS